MKNSIIKLIIAIIISVPILICEISSWSLSQGMIESSIDNCTIISDDGAIYETIIENLDTVTATIYHAVASQCNNEPLITASGKRISSTETAYQHRYLAVSRDLLSKYPYGTKVIISNCPTVHLNGVWDVQDTMNERYKNCIDFLVNPTMKTGKWTEVNICKVID